MFVLYTSREKNDREKDDREKFVVTTDKPICETRVLLFCIPAVSHNGQNGRYMRPRQVRSYILAEMGDRYVSLTRIPADGMRGTTVHPSSIIIFLLLYYIRPSDFFRHVMVALIMTQQ